MLMAFYCLILYTWNLWRVCHKIWYCI